MADNISERLDKIASLLDKGLGVNTKSASAPEPISAGNEMDLKTSLRMGIYMQAKKASYLEAFMAKERVND